MWLLCVLMILCVSVRFRLVLLCLVEQNGISVFCSIVLFMFLLWFRIFSCIYCGRWVSCSLILLLGGLVLLQVLCVFLSRLSSVWFNWVMFIWLCRLLVMVFMWNGIWCWRLVRNCSYCMFCNCGCGSLVKCVQFWMNFFRCWVCFLMVVNIFFSCLVLLCWISLLLECVNEVIGVSELLSLWLMMWIIFFQVCIFCWCSLVVSRWISRRLCGWLLRWKLCCDR